MADGELMHKVDINSALSLQEQLDNIVPYEGIGYAPKDKSTLILNDSLERFYQALTQKSEGLVNGKIEIVAYRPNNSENFETHGGPSQDHQTTIIYYAPKTAPKRVIFESLRDLNDGCELNTYEFSNVHGKIGLSLGEVTLSTEKILENPELFAEKIISALNG